MTKLHLPRLPWPLLTFALALRLALMPFTFHPDLLFIQAFPWQWSAHGIWEIYGELGRNTLGHGITFYPPLVLMTVAGWQWLTRGIAFGFDGWMERVHEAFYTAQDASPVDLLSGFAAADIWRWIFIAKLLYLVLDLGCWASVRSIVKARPEWSALEKLWLFSPVLIFGTYVFGQYRVLTALLIWVAVRLFLQDRRKSAFLLLGAAFLSDNFILVIAAPTILIWGRDLRERAVLSLCLAAVPLLVLVPWGLASDGLVFHCYYSPQIQKGVTVGIFRSMPAWMGLAFKGLFISLWCWLILRLRRLDPKQTPDRLVTVWACACAWVLFALYAVSITSVHYYLWVLPFVVFLEGSGQAPWKRAWMGLAVACLFFFNLDTRALNLGFFVPLWRGFADLPSLHEIMQNYLPWGKVVALARLAFSVLCCAFVFWISRHPWMRPPAVTRKNPLSS